MQNRNLRTTLFSLVFAGCVSSPNRPSQSIQMSDSTILVPAKYLDNQSNLKAAAAIRQGPGSQFKLKSRVLPKKTWVVVIDRYRLWSKIYAPQYREAGWVHSKQLQSIVPAAATITLPKKTLSRVFIKPSEKFYLTDFESGIAELYESSVKQAQFLQLMRKDHFRLIVHPYSKKLTWIDQRDSY